MDRIKILYEQLKQGKISSADAAGLLKELGNQNGEENNIQTLGSTVENHLFHEIKIALIKNLSDLLQVPAEDIDTEIEIEEYGIDAVTLTSFINKVNKQYKLELDASVISIHETLRSIAEHIAVRQMDYLDNSYCIQEQKEVPEKPRVQVISSVSSDIIAEKAVEYFKKLLSSVIKLPSDKIETEAPMEQYGIDSVMVMQLTSQLEKIFGSLPKTLFFEYQNLKELTGYFLESYREQLIPLLGIAEAQETTTVQQTIAEETVQVVPQSRRHRRFGAVKQDIGSGKSTENEIAIIGLAGRYPGANNINEFWENLKNGKDCITEIPKDRWDYSLYFDEDKNKEGKTYSKWGGFIDGVDRFDPLFFNISPREAEKIDPQERLFLQCVYEAIEDGGYTKESLSSYRGEGMDGNIGVYVGVMYEEYQLFGAQEQLSGRNIALGGNPASIANRISYYCNFHGPSMAIDTMCSSSLTAIHLACQGLQRGSCEIAIAGGVNVSIHPNKYLLLSQSKFVSSNGRCVSFGQGGDGYVPGEGVGAVLLKPLSRAIKDGDHIYGIVKGTAVNHGGKTNGYTVPNPNAQANVVGKAMKEAGINPRTVSYIEAHGTGTSLGDPIEISGLTKCFEEYTKDRQYCAIGSVKSNIGHCESAAGIASITKVLLQMKHGQIVPSLHSRALNPNIDFTNTPFTVQQELTKWKKPVVEIDGQANECPRIAGISSFGAGGSNSHVLIEEYIPTEEKQAVEVNSSNPVIIVLSARNGERLKDQVQRLAAAVEEQKLSLSLTNMAYTLQVGREAMEERLAVVVGSIEELLQKLRDYSEGQADIEGLYLGQIKQNKEAISLFTTDEDTIGVIDSWIEKKKYGKIAELWVKGVKINWDKLYGNRRPQRTSLPTYPFAQERYWIPALETAVFNGVSGCTATAVIHPLVHQNTSDFSEQRFSSTFTGSEFFLADHVVNECKILPAVAYLEMTRKAVELAVGKEMGEERRVIRLKNIIWARPAVVEEKPLKVHIGMFPEDNGDIYFEIYSEASEELIIHSQGSAVLLSGEMPHAVDVHVLEQQCSCRTVTADQCYEVFESAGICYGSSHRGIEQLYLGEKQVLAKLKCPLSTYQIQGQFVLHPALLDSALQSTIGLIIGDSGIMPNKIGLPFALQEISVFGSCTETMWAFIRYGDGNSLESKIKKIDIDLYDEKGNVCAVIKGFSTRDFIEKESLHTGEHSSEGMQEQPIEEPRVSVNSIEEKDRSQTENATISEKAVHYFKRQISSIIKLPANQIETEAPMEQYGIDSVMIMQLTNQLEKTFGSLPKTLFFEYRNIQELTEYFLSSYKDKLVPLLGIEEKQDIPAVQQTRMDEPTQIVAPKRRRTRFSGVGQYDSNYRKEEIAIIGLSGRYPGANNVNQFWENLKNGKDCITEIPKDRWDHSLYFDVDKNKKGKTYSKWGGFIDGVDKFDPLFFNISPREAEMMDPQERLFLQCVYETMEDAGYTREALSSHRGQGMEGNIGVYVGVMYEEYQLYGAQEQIQGRNVALGGNPASIANRVSYYCNFHGPSMAVDTMCSSSITAIHLAYQSLKNGSCEMAIAGGVNVSVHPNKYLALGQGKFVSSKGLCESFGQGGDGYVPGEGVGAVLLKPLSKAIADGDQIYGIIKGTAVNHGGKTNGFTVPNPKAQAEVVGRVLKESGVNPRTVSYIEAHGTGTSLGDPIEIAGLTKCFEEYTKDRQYCAIGSAKSNIGHCESAAGIAGITKVLLQMKHGQIVPSLHSSTLNPNIDFDNTPFVVQQKLEKWKRPVAEINGQAREYPRLAGISAFGAGGSNGHIVIEEYIPEEQDQPMTVDAQNPAIIVLSAKNSDRLKEQVQRLIAAIEEHSVSLSDMAYTLQVGREAMEERLALTAGTLQEVLEKLKGYYQGEEGIEGLYRGQVKQNKEALSLFAADEDMEKTLDAWVEKKKYGKLAAMWVKGLNFNWNRLYSNRKPKRISLPTYPFVQESYWVPAMQEFIGNGMVSSNVGVIHPLLHRNTSSFMEQRFSSTFTGNETFLANHKVNGKKVLPAVAYIEMARMAVEIACESSEEDKKLVRFNNLAWLRPVIVEEKPVQVNIGLSLEDNGKISFEVYTQDKQGGDDTVHSHGSAMLANYKEVPLIDIKALQQKLNKKVIMSKQLYDAFDSRGIRYGIAHQGIQKIYVGDREMLARLELPETALDSHGNVVLQPGIMDSALQATIGLMIDEEPMRTLLPFAMRSLEIFGKCTSPLWANVRYSTETKSKDGITSFDIDLCDDVGRICAKIEGFTVKAVSSSTPISKHERLIFEPIWKEQGIPAIKEKVNGKHSLLLFGIEEEIVRVVDDEMKEVECIPVQFKNNPIEEYFTNTATEIFKIIQDILKQKPSADVLVQAVVPMQDGSHLLGGLSGLFKTAALENPRFRGQVIEVGATENAQSLIHKIKENSGCLSEGQVRYSNGKRKVLVWNEVKQTMGEIEAPWMDGGVYLITGGAGGLGLIFAKEIASKVKKPILILTGRSVLGNSKQRELEELRETGAIVQYRQADVTAFASVEELVAEICAEHGTINGIIHSAGMTKDNFIIKKSNEEFAQVLQAKVTGTVNLDRATKDISLDFFILFSSLAGAVGNLGQSDYAAANAFMDAYAEQRNTMTARKERRGATLSVNWPLWKEGGMNVTREVEEMMRQSMGIVPMDTRTGIEALYYGLAYGKSQIAVAEGELQKMRTVFLEPNDGLEEPVSANSTEEKDRSQREDAVISEKAVHYFKRQISSIIKLPANQIETEAPMEQYGIDSVMIMQLTNQLEKTFGSLPKTLFFEYRNIQELTEYFLSSYKDKLVPLLGIEEKQDIPAVQQTRMDEPTQIVAPKRRRTRFSGVGQYDSNYRKEEIAIIGLSGRYPGANNVNQFWENLKNGKDCITEIPKDRWDHSLYFDVDKNKKGKTYSKWGGFIDGVDKFDPLFFNISPREAEMMDPQERLFLQCVYETMEDAGYTREALSSHRGQGMEGNIGVYVGVMYEEYQLYGAQEQIQGRNVALGGNPASIANRVSYYCNFHGPSMAVDTMCSSSITAIHLAYQSLKNGSCEMAIAGGVNVSVHPNKYLALGQGKFVSSKGLCESFGQGGDGYVPGEGVGAVLLKPLSKAIADGDQIYGIIKGTAVNHGGKTNGFTVPNPKAQAEVVGRVLKESGVNPRTVSYIEAHGTGTSLGDPIEIAGLTKCFEEYTKDRQYCAIGSAKSNIGHCESAAGIAGITKVLLQMKHGQIVPSLHSSTLNPNIDFDNTPFVVQQKLEKWKRPVAEINGQAREYPRLAGISAFGAGGSNGHIVIEEYIPEEQDQPMTVDAQNPAIIVLSAKNSDRLKEQVQRLIAAIEEHSVSLSDMAYTLQVGREAMEERLALTAGTLQEVLEKLKGYYQGEEGIEGLYRGQVKQNKEALSLFAADEDMEKTLDAWVEKKKYGKLAAMWVKGLNFNWNRLYSNRKPKRISLPTYPFVQESYWVSKGIKTEAVAASGVLRPMADSASLSRVSKSESALDIAKAPKPLEVKVLEKAKGISLEAVDKKLEVASSPSTRKLISLEEPQVQEASVHIKAGKVNLEEELAKSLARTLNMSEDDVDTDENFINLGLDSITGVEWVQEINKQFDTHLAATKVYDYPTISELAAFIAKEQGINVGSTKVAGNLVPQSVSSLEKSGVKVLEGTKGISLEAVDEKLEVACAPSTRKSISLEQSEVQDEVKASVHIKAVKVNLEEELAKSLARTLNMSEDDIDTDEKFIDMGLDSITGVEWVQEINKQFDTHIAATKVYDYPSIGELAAFIKKELRMGGAAIEKVHEEIDLPLSLQDLVQQVQRGTLNIEQAEQLLQNM